MLASVKHAKVSTVTFSFDIRLRGQRSKKVKFQTMSNGKTNNANMLALVKHAKVSTVTSPSDLQFRGQRSKNVKYQTTLNGKTNGANILAWSTKVKFQTMSISKIIIANQLALEKHAKVSTVNSSTDLRFNCK